MKPKTQENVRGRTEPTEFPAILTERTLLIMYGRTGATTPRKTGQKSPAFYIRELLAMLTHHEKDGK